SGRHIVTFVTWRERFMFSDSAARLAVLFVLATCCRLPEALAQTTTATLQGVVRDATQAVRPGAAVTLRDVSTGFVRATTTDPEGAYVLTYVPTGTYELTVELTGFRTIKRERL